MENELSQQSIEYNLALLHNIFYEESLEKGLLALEALSGVVPDGLQEQLLRLPDYSPLAASLVAHADLLQAYPATFGVLAALRAERIELLQSAGAEVVAPLVHICQSKAKKISKTARTVLLSLTRLEAQDELCRLASDKSLEVARETALEAGFLPRDGRARALFLFVTRQWEQYETLDFDAGLMRSVYDSADRRLQQFIATVGREAGRPEIFKIMSGRGNRQLTFDEWQAAAQALIQGQCWQEAWTLALKAPSVTAALLLKALIQAGWHPSEPAEQFLFADLTKRALRLSTTTLPFGHEVVFVPESEKATPRWFYTNNYRAIQQALITPNGQLQIIIYQGRQAAEIWDVSALDIVWTYNNTALYNDIDPHGHKITNYYVRQAGVSASGDYLILMESVYSKKNSLYYRFLVYEVQTGQHIQTFYPPLADNASHDKYWYSYEVQPGDLMPILSHDGRFAAAMFNKHFVVWRVGEDVPIAFERLRFNSARMTFTSNNSHLLVGNHLFRLEPWQLIANTQAESGLSAFSADGELIAFASTPNNGKLRLYQVSEYRFLRQKQADFENVYSIVFSLDKNRVVTGHFQVIRIWDVPSLTLINEFVAHDSAIVQLWFKTDGKTLYSYSEDGKLKEWQTPTMERAETPIEKLSIQDLRDLRQRYASSRDKAWFAFMDGLVSQRFQHAIELGELDPAVNADEFDIEIE